MIFVKSSMKVTAIEIKIYQWKNILTKSNATQNYVITNLKKSRTWRTIAQSTIAINFVSAKDTDKNQVMHSKSDNKEVVLVYF